MISRNSVLVTVASGLLAVTLAACSNGNASPSKGTTGGSGSSNGPIVAAGSTFVAPLMSKWQSDYASKTGETVTYGAIGSGGGIEQITARTVDMGASDAPMTPDQLKAAKGVIQIPWSLGAVVPAYNLKDAPDHLKLTGAVLADMYLGNVKTWNDPAIASLNPGVKLPSTKVTPVYRSDGSGDTYAFTDYLSKVSPTFKSQVGVSTQVKFPTGVGGDGSSGVASAVSATDGAIGYLTIAYVNSSGFHYALLKNAAGNYPEASVPDINAAAATAKSVPPGGVSITDPPASAANAWPDSTFTYVIIPKHSPKAASIKKFITYALGPGQAFATDLGYGTLPKPVIADDKTALQQISG
ncbi:MAG: phosphate transport system substrate-binding protein [Actinomycetota bacterium]|jgi:phosphate transport system substrate-binding protein|nr:phosphate transport system substrate-binding protein [Actinomycetota bacterium]